MRSSVRRRICSSTALSLALPDVLSRTGWFLVMPAPSPLEARTVIGDVHHVAVTIDAVHLEPRATNGRQHSLVVGHGNEAHRGVEWQQRPDLLEHSAAVD